MRNAIILALAVFGTLASVIPTFATSAHALAGVDHNETFVTVLD